MPVTVSNKQVAVGIRLIPADDADIEDGELQIVRRQCLAAVAIVEQYAPDAPDELLNEAVILTVGYLYDMPPSSSNHANAFRHSGAMALLAWWRNPHSGIVGADADEGDSAAQTPLNLRSPAI